MPGSRTPPQFNIGRSHIDKKRLNQLFSSFDVNCEDSLDVVDFCFTFHNLQKDMRSNVFLNKNA